MPVSPDDFRLIRNVAHLVLQWDMNATGSFPPSCETGRGEVLVLAEVEADRRADPLRRPLDDLPHDPGAGMQSRIFIAKAQGRGRRR